MFALSCILLTIVSLQTHIQTLDAELDRSAQYDAEHEQRISRLHDRIADEGESFDIYQNLFELYASYKFDSAYCYVRHLERLAQTPNEMAIAKIKKSFILFSAGLFKESHDLLASITDIDQCAREVQERYYCNFARLCLDEGTYTGEPYYAQYTLQAIELLDKQLALLTPQDTISYNYAWALKTMKQGQYQLSLDYFRKCLTATQCSDHQWAIVYSSMAFPASQLGEDDLAMDCIVKAAIYDIRSSTKEGVALRLFATQLYEQGYTDRAHQYIMQASRDADIYGARHRKMEVSHILPIIEHEILHQEQARQRLAYVLVAVLLIGMSLLSLLLFYLNRKMRALSKAHDTIERMNTSLNELGKLKEEYIGSFLSWQSDTIRAVDSANVHINRLARERDLKGLIAFIEAQPKHNRRQEFMQQFDRMFLRICPNFVENFNNLLKPEYRIRLEDGEPLTTELRIFALIRLGITTNDQIASVLDYSLNTIYTYKTRMRNRSILNSDAFYTAAAQC